MHEMSVLKKNGVGKFSEEVQLLPHDTRYPRDADETIFHFDFDRVAIGKLVEVDPINRNPLKLISLTPGTHN